MQFTEALELACKRRQLSPETMRKYIKWSREYILYLDKQHPRNFGEKKIGNFLESLLKDRGLSISSTKQAEAALKFTYKHLLRRDISTWDFSHIYEPERFLAKVLGWL